MAQRARQLGSESRVHARAQSRDVHDDEDRRAHGPFRAGERVAADGDRSDVRESAPVPSRALRPQRDARAAQRDRDATRRSRRRADRRGRVERARDLDRLSRRARVVSKTRHRARCDEALSLFRRADDRSRVERTHDQRDRRHDESRHAGAAVARESAPHRARAHSRKRFW